MRVPKRKSEESIQRDEGPFLMTAKALQLLETELKELEAKVPEMIKEVEHTKSHGDFSENAAYQHAKHMLRQNYGRMRRINIRIKNAQIISSSKNTTGIIAIGSKIEVERDGKKFIFEILGSHEADPASGKISNVSPLGKLLLGAKVGDTLQLNLKEKNITYKVLNVN